MCWNVNRGTHGAHSKTSHLKLKINLIIVFEFMIGMVSTNRLDSFFVMFMLKPSRAFNSRFMQCSPSSFG